LTAKDFKPKLNVMDNQARKHIKKFLTKNDCKLQVVEPHIHQVDAAERAIQTFKAAFIAALQQRTAISHCSCGTDLPPSTGHTKPFACLAK
jgi:hypothetical protein